MLEEKQGCRKKQNGKGNEKEKEKKWKKRGMK